MGRLETRCSHFAKAPFFKMIAQKKHFIFRIGRTSALILHTLDTSVCNIEKRVCVCIVLVHYGPFPQKINGKSVHAHFTFFSAQFGHSHFHGSAGLVPRSSFWHCVMNTQALTKLTQSHPLEKRSYRDKK